MIDAGAILKLQNAKISVGSEAIDEDRSLAALQVLGAPQILDHDGVVIDGTVHLTSLREERRDGVLFGIDVLPGQPTPTSGDWGGIEFRNDFDYSEGRPVWESEGIFLDYVSHADIRYGGGSITPLDPAVTPLQLHQSRPTLIHNQISEAREAAISADPDSFLETNFSAPIFQQASLDRIGTEFTSDYVRVGPHIRGNTLTDNSINGLFVRVRTPATDERQPMTVSGRFDDFDVTHVLSEALVLAGDAGGPVLSEVRPDGPGVSVNPAAGSGTLAPGDSIHYRITFVTTDGFESVASLPTETAVVGPSGTLELTDLPPAPEEFAGRRLYRLKPTAPSDPSIDYELVTMLDRATPNYTDDGTTRGGQLSPAALNERPNVAPVNFSSATGSLTPGDEFDYRITFYTDSGFETLASAATATATVAADGGVSLFTLPRAPEVFAGRNLYRLDPAGHYELIAQLNRIDTIYVDDGTTLGDPLNPNLLGDQTGERLIPSPDARLAIDPGVVVKLDSARIQAQFGADFYAEGTARNPIIFTSRLDDTYGAGGTFDTNNDGDSGTPAAGDWGGLVFRQGSTGSIDHAVIGFGGGESAEAGEFAFYNPIEILQADARVTHTVIRDNADRHDGTFAIRGGLGFNSPAAIFVRGAQPILVDNIIRDSEGAAISINPDALTHHEVADWGRSTGPIDQLPGDPDNQGPLIQRNLIGGNDINGLSVRNESLSTESVWDDTDIVHVVEGQVYAWNHHHRSSLRLESDPGQSLVVKFGPGGALVADRYGTARQHRRHAASHRSARFSGDQHVDPRLQRRCRLYARWAGQRRYRELRRLPGSHQSGRDGRGHLVGRYV